MRLLCLKLCIYRSPCVENSYTCCKAISSICLIHKDGMFSFKCGKLGILHSKLKKINSCLGKKIDWNKPFHMELSNMTEELWSRINKNRLFEIGEYKKKMIDENSETMDYLQPKDCLIPLNIRPTDLPIIQTSRNDTALLTLVKAALKKGMLMSQNSRHKLKQYLLQATEKMAHYSKIRRNYHSWASIIVHLYH